MERQNIADIMPDTLSDELQSVVTTLLPLAVDIELCGEWLWISGDTRPHRDTLKELKCRWSARKKRWYYCPKAKRRGYHGKRREVSMGQIRVRYGSQSVASDDD